MENGEEKNQRSLLARWFKSEYYGMSLSGVVKDGFKAMVVGLLRLPSLDLMNNAIGFEYTSSWFKKLVETTKINNITLPEAAILYFTIGPVLACEAFLYMIKTPILKTLKRNE